MNIDEKDALRKFKEQRRCALKRKDKAGNQIEWLLTFEEWMQIWIDSGKWVERGPRIDQYCMARHGDIGPYSTDNVAIITGSENKRQGMLGGNSTSYKKGHQPSDKNKQRVSEVAKQRHLKNRIEKYIEYLESQGYTINK